MKRIKHVNLWYSSVVQLIHYVHILTRDFKNMHRVNASFYLISYFEGVQWTLMLLEFEQPIILSRVLWISSFLSSNFLNYHSSSYYLLLATRLILIIRSRSEIFFSTNRYRFLPCFTNYFSILWYQITFNMFVKKKTPIFQSNVLWNNKNMENLYIFTFNKLFEWPFDTLDFSIIHIFRRDDPELAFTKNHQAFCLFKSSPS